MKRLVVSAAALLTAACSSGEKTPAIKHPYLGQDLPGLTPTAFAPGLVSTDHWEYGGVFSPDMREFYLIRSGGEYKEQTFTMFKYEDETWTESTISKRAGQPTISPDGKTMHLGRRYKERTETGWSEVKMLAPPLSDQLIMRLSAAENGTYYFDTYDPDNPAFPIRSSRLIDGKYEQPKPLPAQINTGTHRNHPFIAPDESYLIWDAKREVGYGSSDIYISFRQKDGSWGEAQNLGSAINTDAWEAAASVTPDGKYLFFHRNIGSDEYENVDIYWVDAKVIEDLRPNAD